MDRTRELITQLREYVPADLTEATHHHGLMTLLLRGDESFSRTGFEPGHITASCFIVDSSYSRVLLHRHKRLGRWLQMGGHVDMGETVVQAALREGVEESGLRDLMLLAPSFIDLDVHPIPAGNGEPAHSHFDVRYLARTERPDSIALASEESSELVWVDLRRAAVLMDEGASTRVLQKIERLFA